MKSCQYKIIEITKKGGKKTYHPRYKRWILWYKVPTYTREHEFWESNENALERIREHIKTEVDSASYKDEEKIVSVKEIPFTPDKS